MNRIIGWIKRQGDPNVVTYSRFGLPGEETDDRPVPTEIHVASFDEAAREYFIARMHVQKAALITAAVGMGLTIFIFIAILFEMNWYNHTKGVDLLALTGLILFLVCGLMTHWHVIVGVKKGHPKYLLPCIVVYIVMLAGEAMLAMFGLYHYAALQSIDVHPAMFPNQMASKNFQEYHASVSKQVLFGVFLFLFALALQGSMLYTVIRCRLFLVRKQTHALEIRVAQKSIAQHPGMRIVETSGNNNVVNSNGSPAPPSAPTQAFAENGVANPNHVPVEGSSHIGVVHETIGTPPPSYDRSQQEHHATAPTRTLFTSSDREIL